ncbi:hypothetical protein C4901_11445 [Acidiferrobacter sp. SPIII_3]|nr:hypothetical protein C4901_11445 [Acidiferrobacter sp. SPIII_3]
MPVHALVDLIHEREELALLPIDLVYAEGRDAGEIQAFAAPDHGHLHGAKDAFPAGLKAPRDHLPAQQLSPAGEKPGKALRDGTFAQGPWQILDVNAACVARQPPGRVQEPGRHAPQRHELKAPLGKGVVARCGLLALRAVALPAFMRAQADLDGRHGR